MREWECVKSGWSIPSIARWRFTVSTSVHMGARRLSGSEVKRRSLQLVMSRLTGIGASQVAVASCLQGWDDVSAETRQGRIGAGSGQHRELAPANPGGVGLSGDHQVRQIRLPLDKLPNPHQPMRQQCEQHRATIRAHECGFNRGNDSGDFTSGDPLAVPVRHPRYQITCPLFADAWGPFRV